MIGCGLLITEIILFILFGHYIPELKESFFPVILADILAGRGASISLGLELGLSKVLVILISVIFNLTWFFILYPLIIYFYEYLIEIKLIGKAFSSTKNKAEEHRSKIEKWGALGIAFFVWVPLYSTGSLVGAIIGTLIGMRTITVIRVVVLAMIISIISWTFAFDYLLKFAERSGKIVPLIFVGLVFGIAVFHRLRNVFQSRLNKK